MSTPLRVLIAEDSEEDALILAYELEKGGIPLTFERVDRPKDMAAALCMQPWDLILCDYAMPSFNGLDALKIFKESGQDLPFILVSGKIDEEEAVETLKAGAHDFVSKSNLARLVPAVRRELREAAGRRERRQAEEAFRSLFFNAPIGIFIVQQGKFELVNPGFLTLTGYHQEDLLDHDSLAFLAPGERSAVKANLVRVLKEQDAEPYEFKYFTKAGESRWAAETVVSTSFQGDRATLGYFMDITKIKKAEEALKQSLEKLKRTFEDTARALSAMVEMRDPYTAGHQRRVARLACAIARELGSSPEQLEGILVAGFIHDIGKFAVPAEILNRPGKLKDLELNIVKAHATVGYEVVKEIDFPWPVAQAILQHHERLDGSGYPLGLTDGQILFEAKILAVADVVEAMAAHRPYRPALGLDQALAEISQKQGILYDSEAVEVCTRLFAENRFHLENRPPFPLAGPNGR